MVEVDQPASHLERADRRLVLVLHPHGGSAAGIKQRPSLLRRRRHRLVDDARGRIQVVQHPTPHLPRVEPGRATRDVSAMGAAESPIPTRLVAGDVEKERSRLIGGSGTAQNARCVRSDPSCFTSLLYKPKIRNVGAHWPTKRLACLLPMSCNVIDVAIEPDRGPEERIGGQLCRLILDPLRDRCPRCVPDVPRSIDVAMRDPPLNLVSVSRHSNSEQVGCQLARLRSTLGMMYSWTHGKHPSTSSCRRKSRHRVLRRSRHQRGAALDARRRARSPTPTPPTSASPTSPTTTRSRGERCSTAPSTRA